MAGHWGGQAAGGAELMTIDALTDSVETVLDSVGWDTAHVGAAS
jgi:hypothetical protein